MAPNPPMPRNSLLKCGACGYQNAAGEKFCSECGASLISHPTQPLSKRVVGCQRCGAESPFGRKFCGQCGTMLLEGIGESAANPLVTQSAVASVPGPNGLLRPESVLQERYKITRVIGQGGMGAIYQAADMRFANRSCVIKEMLDHFNDPEQRLQATQSFIREADILACLHHDGIPEVFDRFTQDNRHYLVMQFIDGVDLEQRLINDGKAQVEKDVVNWAIQVCDLLSYLHSQRPAIIYRDMKPANLILSPSGRIFLVDFGIARFFNPNTRGTMIGTQGYAPPEQYRGQVEQRSDLYALAATMHHLLTERDPQTEAPFSFPAVRSLNNSVSVETERAIQRALENDIDKRFANADEMRDALIGISRKIAAQVRVCPYCRQPISVTKQICPHCSEYIAAPPALASDTGEIAVGGRMATAPLGFWERFPWWAWLLTLVMMVSLVMIGILIGMSHRS